MYEKKDQDTSRSRANTMTMNTLDNTIQRLYNTDQGPEGVALDNEMFFSSMNSLTALNWESYDDITRMSLEIMFHQFYKSNSDPQYRYVDITPSSKIDLKEWVELDNDDATIKKRIKRAKNHFKERPLQSVRFTDASPFVLDRATDGMHAKSHSNVQWLAYQWYL